MEKTRPRLDWKVLALCFVLVLLMVGVLFYPNIGTDSYAYFSDPGPHVRRVLTENGRPINALLYLPWLVFGIPDLVMYEILIWLAVVLFSVAVYLVAQHLRAYIRIGSAVERCLLCVAAAFLLVFNPFTLDIFQYLECAAFALSALFAVCAFLAVQRFFARGGARWLVLCGVLMACSALTFQSPTGLFVVLNLPFLLLDSKDTKTFLKRNAIVAAFYGGAGLTVLFYMRFLVRSGRVDDSGAGLGQRIARAFAGTVPMLWSRLHFLLPVFILCLLACLVLSAAAQGQGRARDLLGVLYLCAGTLATAMMPYLFYGQESAWRVAWPLASLIGLLLFYLVARPLPQNALWRVLLRLLTLGTCLLLLAVWSIFQEAWVQRFQENAQEKLVAAAVEQRVEAYERESGQTVTGISFYRDAASTAPETVAAYRHAWSRNSFFAVLIGRRWQEEANDPAIAAAFAARDWNAYSDEQLVFRGSTLHLCLW